MQLNNTNRLYVQYCNYYKKLTVHIISNINSTQCSSGYEQTSIKVDSSAQATNYSLQFTFGDTSDLT